MQPGAPTCFDPATGEEPRPAFRVLDREQRMYLMLESPAAAPGIRRRAIYVDRPST